LFKRFSTAHHERQKLKGGKAHRIAAPRSSMQEPRQFVQRSRQWDGLTVFFLLMPLPSTKGLNSQVPNSTKPTKEAVILLLSEEATPALKISKMVLTFC
jgi:hypothetical protein